MEEKKNLLFVSVLFKNDLGNIPFLIYLFIYGRINTHISILMNTGVKTDPI